MIINYIKRYAKELSTLYEIYNFDKLALHIA